MKVVKTNENILTSPILKEDPKLSLEDLDDDVFFDIDGSDKLDDVFALDEAEDKVPETARLGVESAVATQLNALIIDEFEAIQGYNSTIVSLQNEPNCENIIKVLKDIVYEENVHVGQLQKLLQTVSPNASGIDKGNEEAEEQIMSKEEVPMTSINADDAPSNVIDFSGIDDVNFDTVPVVGEVAHPFMKVESFPVTAHNTQGTTQQEEAVDTESECSLLNIDDEM